MTSDLAWPRSYRPVYELCLTQLGRKNRIFPADDVGCKTAFVAYNLMRDLLREIAIPTTLIVLIFGAYFVALHLGYVPDALANFVIIACVMIIGLVVFVVRAVLWKEISWDKAIEQAWFFFIAGFFFVGIPFGACALLSSFFTSETSYSRCLGFGVVAGLLAVGWIFWIDPWLERRPKRVKSPCPACRRWTLKLVKASSGETYSWGEPMYRYVYRCFDCGWEDHTYQATQVTKRE